MTTDALESSTADEYEPLSDGVLVCVAVDGGVSWAEAVRLARMEGTVLKVTYTVSSPAATKPHVRR